MPRFHLYKKVITWNQLWKFCRHRQLSKLCDIMPSGKDKSCKCDDYTKGLCPIWNGELENLVMFSPPERFHNEQRENARSPVKKREFREDEEN